VTREPNSNAALRTECGRSLALLVADALAFTPNLVERQRELLVAALRQVATGEVEEEHEASWVTLFLDAGMQTTAAYNPQSEEVLRGR
jgi:hypothetical protein